MVLVRKSQSFQVEKEPREEEMSMIVTAVIFYTTSTANSYQVLSSVFRHETTKKLVHLIMSESIQKS